MAYQMRGLPDWVYSVAHTGLRTPFAEWPESWNPWESENDALELVGALQAMGVPVRIRAWSTTTSFSDLAQPGKEAVRRYKLPQSWKSRPQLHRVSIGESGLWAVAPTLSEAICRAYVFFQKTGGLARWEAR